MNHCQGAAAGDRANRLGEGFLGCAEVMKTNGPQNGSNGSQDLSVGPAAVADALPCSFF